MVEIEFDDDAQTKTANGSGEVVTKLHPLRPAWDFWIWLKEEGRGWRACIHRQATVETVEDYCALMSRIKKLNQLQHGMSIFFMRDGIEPMWEDKQNCKGGALELDAGPDFYNKLDRILQEVLMLVFGNQFGPRFNKCINGVEANRRRVRIWLGTCERDKYIGIGEQLSIKLGLGRKVRFEPHNDRQRRDALRHDTDTMM